MKLPDSDPDRLSGGLIVEQRQLFRFSAQSEHAAASAITAPATAVRQRSLACPIKRPFPSPGRCRKYRHDADLVRGPADPIKFGFSGPPHESLIASARASISLACEGATPGIWSLIPKEAGAPLSQIQREACKLG
jgi:hypothetical protein